MWSLGLRLSLLPMRSAIGLKISANGFSNVSRTAFVVPGSGAGALVGFYHADQKRKASWYRGAVFIFSTSRIGAASPSYNGLGFLCVHR